MTDPLDSTPKPASDSASSDTPVPVHRRRVRYSGKNPKRFEEKYKEHNPDRYGDTVAKVLASGKTPAGTHRPIMVKEILEVLAPKPGEVAVDCTLGYGGHAREILALLRPNGRLFGLDVDPVELPKTEKRLRDLGYGPEMFTAHRSNYAGLPQILGTVGLLGVDMILADLGVSSMQIDDPVRGFSVKLNGPLDMRMNPSRGQSAAHLLQKVRPEVLTLLLADYSDEPHAKILGPVLAERHFNTTNELADAIRAALPHVTTEERNLSIRRVFQAIRIAVNDEFSALETFLRNLPFSLKPGGRVAILTFHSGEDRRVKKAFQAGERDGFFSEIAEEILRPSLEERNDNPRSSPAKLRWAKKATTI